ncbi:hypothetical protein ISF_01449 [Cordyceps fumosorosea ARSEF 2679]|uniref:Uncharacterized protein n=1 Tax=Cordyceps fumosorosea (strain ARSEF 2679) TaxID=1081104 RepID=A0A168DAV4_CORFA|nr:hypothetical protein ISF_01449 [Cordyceps fumosorosea ARSEF 2679]OAA72376.1 hypothetical protein ISF_01449 [Cordyceps fumosorosea ARSEF 2679]
MGADYHAFPEGEEYLSTQASMNGFNRRLRRAIKILAVLAVVTVMTFLGVAYMAVQLGKEREYQAYLEAQLQAQHDDPSGKTLSKRFPFWFLGAALWTGNQVFAFYSLATSCKEFTSSAGNAATCVWGAISTAATFIGVAKHGASTVKIIHDRLAQNGISIGGWKRDDAVLEAEETLSRLFNMPVALDGFMPHHHPKLARLALTEGTLWPVFHMYNHHNSSLHFTLTAHEADHSVMSLGFGHKSNEHPAAGLARREKYNDEYFSNGGIDYTDCFNDQQDVDLLNKDGDYQQMDRDVQCYFPDLSNTWGAEIQIYDSKIRGTIGSGSIAAFRGSDHASSISAMPGCPSGLKSTDKCKKA